ncbi:MAG: glycosyltransferase [Phycicoccus sp.]|nr:glycosyltransferase [Phycicoccus sp.]
MTPCQDLLSIEIGLLTVTVKSKDSPSSAPATLGEVASDAALLHRVSVVIPVYQGETTLDAVVGELLAMPDTWVSAGGNRLEISEVLLVWDNGPDGSAEVIRRLVAQHDRVRPIFLSRNFGQHAATLAGMASSGGDWIVTMDEDGQHDPGAISAMIDVATGERVPVVYAEPTNPAPHGRVRNAASRAAKLTVAALSGGAGASQYQSYRLILGEVGRSVAAYAGSGVYLDVALGWVASSYATCPVELRCEGGRASGYSTRSLLSHFWRMVISSGTRGLRVVSVLGVVFATLGVLGAVWLLMLSLAGGAGEVRGWASMMVTLLVTSGAILFSLGVIAEYVGVAVNMAMGKPLYLIVSDPAVGPMGRRRSPR